MNSRCQRITCCTEQHPWRKSCLRFTLNSVLKSHQVDFGGLAGKEILKIQTQAYQAGGKAVRCFCDKGFRIWIMHYQKLTSVWMGGGRFLCIQIPQHNGHKLLCRELHTSCTNIIHLRISLSFLPEYYFVLIVRIWGRKPQITCEILGISPHPIQRGLLKP